MQDRFIGEGTVLAARLTHGRELATLLARVVRFAIPLVLAIGLSVALLVAGRLSLSPGGVWTDIGSGPVPARGVYSSEENEQISYVYTDGDAVFHLPQTGAGRFVARLRMGGPGGKIPVEAHLSTPAGTMDLGTVAPLRVYHLLLPTMPHGDLEFRLISSTTTLAGDDTRELGVLLDWLHIQALERLKPPPSLLLSIALALTLLWLGLVQLSTAYRRRVLLLLSSSALFGLMSLLDYGGPAIHPWWLLVPSLCVLLAASLNRFEGWRFATPMRDIIALFVAWRVAIWVVGGLGMWYSSAVSRAGHALSDWGHIHRRQGLVGKLLLNTWTQWDGDHYLQIAREGYEFYGERWPRIVWFPLYPLLIRMLTLIGTNEILAALLISHVALFAALLVLYALLARDFDHAVAYRTLVLLLAFPMAFFFGAVYTESLALLFTAGALWALRHQRWWLAGLAGFFLALTRLPGVLIAPILAVVYLHHHQWRWRALLRRPVAAVLLPPLGLALFMLYQWWRFDEPFAFLIGQDNWEQRLSPPWAMPLETIDLLINRAGDWPLRVFQLITWGVFIGLSLLVVFRLPLEYGLIMLLLLPPYLINRSASLPRYVMLGIPAFVILAMLSQQRSVRASILSALLILHAIAVLLFVNGFWIA